MIMNKEKDEDYFDDLFRQDGLSYEENPEDFDSDDQYVEEYVEIKESYEDYAKRMKLQRDANTLSMNIAVIVGMLLFVGLCVGLGIWLCK